MKQEAQDQKQTSKPNDDPNLPNAGTTQPPQENAVTNENVQSEQPLQIKTRQFGVSLLLFQLGFTIVYGLNGAYYTERESSPTKFYQVISVVLCGLFALVGFGLVLSVYRWGNWLGLATAVFVFAVSAQLGPLLQQLWQYVFLSNFIEPAKGYIYENTTTNISKFFDHHRLGSQLKIMLSSYIYQLVFLSCISILTFMTAVIGRLSLLQIFKLTLIYQILWNLNFFLNIFMCVVRQGELRLPYVFDSFGSSYNYLFAACFGFVFTCVVNRQLLPTDHSRNNLNGFSSIMSAIGTAFIFAAFVFSSNYLIVSPTIGENFKRFSMLFALIGSVIGAYIGSAISNKGRIGYKEALIGTITGGVTVGAAASYISNIGIAIMVGTVGGFLSGLLTRPVHRSINKYFMYDTLGLFVPFFVSALFGSIVVPCSVLAWCYYKQINNEGIRSVSAGGYDWYPESQIGYQLIYAAISAGIGVAGGALSGLLCRFDNDKFGLAANARFFVNDFGLYNPRQMVFEEKKNSSHISQSQGLIAPSQT